MIYCRGGIFSVNYGVLGFIALRGAQRLIITPILIHFCDIKSKINSNIANGWGFGVLGFWGFGGHAHCGKLFKKHFKN